MSLAPDRAASSAVGISGVWYGDLSFGGKKVSPKGDMAWNVAIGCMDQESRISLCLIYNHNLIRVPRERHQGQKADSSPSFRCRILRHDEIHAVSLTRSWPSTFAFAERAIYSNPSLHLTTRSLNFIGYLSFPASACHQPASFIKTAPKRLMLQCAACDATCMTHSSSPILAPIMEPTHDSVSCFY